MTQALTRYELLFDSLASRRRRTSVPKGLDSFAQLAAVKVKRGRVRKAWLGRESDAIIALAASIRNHSENALDHEIAQTREVFVRRRQTDETVRRALALVREVARRATGEEAFKVQLMAALALYHGHICEMLTGEGKTLTGSLVAPVLAWRHRSLHILTVNDYLAQRDAQSRGPIYRRCLASVGAITGPMEPAERADVYMRSIVYATPKQIVADWLRDQIRLGPVSTAWQGWHIMSSAGPDRARGMAPMVPGLRAALVDEADAVLIDEGVVPLIIARSRREDDMAHAYTVAAALAQKLDLGPDFEIDHVARRADLKRRGRHRLKAMFDEAAASGPAAGVFRATRRAEELVRQALVARHCYIHGQQYQIVDGKVVIVDEYTGRFLPDRSWEHGLHQSVEAKEGLEITADRETLARLSFQRFFRSYPTLCGMTGTAADAIPEMERVYARPVTVIPTNRPIARVARPTRVFRTQRDKWSAIARSIEEIHAEGRPILVGTRSIAASELLSRLLTERGLPHQVLNAKHDKEEAGVIELAGRGNLDMTCDLPRHLPPHETDAGRVIDERVVEAAGSEFAPGTAAQERAQRDRLGHLHEAIGTARRAGVASITVATNMAGRGTDIKLDDDARDHGGLHVILTEMHGAKRIDRQFIGRAGRQGDPGSSQIFVSLEDELVLKYAPWIAGVIRLQRTQPHPTTSSSDTLTLSPKASAPHAAGEIPLSPVLARLFRYAQIRWESRDRRNRGAVLRQDDWIDRHLPGVG